MDRYGDRGRRGSHRLTVEPWLWFTQVSISTRRCAPRSNGWTGPFGPPNNRAWPHPVLRGHPPASGAACPRRCSRDPVWTSTATAATHGVHELDVTLGERDVVFEIETARANAVGSFGLSDYEWILAFEAPAGPAGHRRVPARTARGAVLPWWANRPRTPRCTATVTTPH